MVAVDVDGSVLEDGFRMRVRTDAEILLAESLHLGVDVDVILLHKAEVSVAPVVAIGFDDGVRRTSCSERGIFWSFIFWTRASAKPSTTAAVDRKAPFMVATAQE